MSLKLTWYGHAALELETRGYHIFNTYDLITQDAQAWAARVRAETPAEAIVLKPGETFTV